MTTLWFLIILMAIIAGLFIVVPVFRFKEVNSTAQSETRRKKNIELFEQRQQELEQELSDELINAEEFSRLKTELQRGFISDMDGAQLAQSKGVVGKVGYNKLIPLSLVLIIPIASFVLYQNIGSAPDLVLPEILARVTGAQSEAEQSQALGDFSVALSERFQREPDDIQNGYMLGTLYLELQEYSSAIDTFTMLAEQMEDSPDKATVLGQLAQANYMAAGSSMNSATQVAIDQALALNPNEFAVMSLLAIEAFVNENFAEAVTYWRRQLLQATPGSEQAAVLADRIAQVETMLLPEELAATAVSGASVTVYVEIDESIRDQIASDMRLFIFARGESVPLPLAAQTFSLEQLPLTITLDDSMAMTPQFTLSSAERVYVGARISRVATAQPGDFQVISETFVVADQTETITLTIKDIVQ